MILKLPRDRATSWPQTLTQPLQHTLWWVSLNAAGCVTRCQFLLRCCFLNATCEPRAFTAPALPVLCSLQCTLIRMKPDGCWSLVLALKVTLRRNPSPDPRTDMALAAGLASPQLVEGASALFLGRAHYGCVATVLPPNTVGLTRKVLLRSRPLIGRCYAGIDVISAGPPAQPFRKAELGDCWVEVRLPNRLLFFFGESPCAWINLLPDTSKDGITCGCKFMYVYADHCLEHAAHLLRLYLRYMERLMDAHTSSRNHWIQP